MLLTFSTFSTTGMKALPSNKDTEMAVSSSTSSSTATSSSSGTETETTQSAPKAVSPPPKRRDDFFDQHVAEKDYSSVIESLSHATEQDNK